MKQSLKGFTQHILIESNVEISALIPNYQELLDLGAIYLNKVRIKDHLPLKSGDYLRVHLKPKRYPILEVNWKDTIIYEDGELIVINKPYGIPVHPTLDNNRENILKALEQTLQQPLYPTHRLDIGTQGVLIFAKNKSRQTQINNEFMNRRVIKIYEAKVDGQPELGIWQHFMIENPRTPKKLLKALAPNTKECVLEVLQNTPTVKIRLVTGRSHQIRSQLAFAGYPVVGDTMYGGRPFDPPRYKAEYFCLRCICLSLPALNLEFKPPENAPT